MVLDGDRHVKFNRSYIANQPNAAEGPMTYILDNIVIRTVVVTVDAIEGGVSEET